MVTRIEFFLRALRCIVSQQCQKPRHAGSICAQVSTPPSQKRARRGPRAYGARMKHSACLECAAGHSPSISQAGSW